MFPPLSRVCFVNRAHVCALDENTTFIHLRLFCPNTHFQSRDGWQSFRNELQLTKARLRGGRDLSPCSVLLPQWPAIIHRKYTKGFKGHTLADGCCSRRIAKSLNAKDIRGAGRAPSTGDDDQPSPRTASRMAPPRPPRETPPGSPAHLSPRTPPLSPSTSACASTSTGGMRPVRRTGSGSALSPRSEGQQSPAAMLAAVLGGGVRPLKSTGSWGSSAESPAASPPASPVASSSSQPVSKPWDGMPRPSYTVSSDEEVR